MSGIWRQKQVLLPNKHCHIYRLYQEDFTDQFNRLHPFCLEMCFVMGATITRVLLFIALSALLSVLTSAVTQYHEQGLHGHHSYKYGFDTGDHFNPQQRYEEADGHGNVKGSFRYMDGTGHMVTVYYKAGKNGFYRSDDPANHKMKESARHDHHVPHPSTAHHHQMHHHNHAPHRGLPSAKGRGFPAHF